MLIGISVASQSEGYGWPGLVNDGWASLAEEVQGLIEKYPNHFTGAHIHNPFGRHVPMEFLQLQMAAETPIVDTFSEWSRVSKRWRVLAYIGSPHISQQWKSWLSLGAFTDCLGSAAEALGMLMSLEADICFDAMAALDDISHPSAQIFGLVESMLSRIGRTAYIEASPRLGSPWIDRPFLILDRTYIARHEKVVPHPRFPSRYGDEWYTQKHIVMLNAADYGGKASTQLQRAQFLEQDPVCTASISLHRVRELDANGKLED